MPEEERREDALCREEQLRKRRSGEKRPERRGLSASTARRHECRRHVQEMHAR